jgi:hypothetical protein
VSDTTMLIYEKTKLVSTLVFHLHIIPPTDPA